MRRDASKVVGSAICIPICAAIQRAIGSYSSAVTVRSIGKRILRRGAVSRCLRVE